MSNPADSENQSEVLRDDPLPEFACLDDFREVAERLGVSERTVENYIAERRLGSRPRQRAGKRALTVVDPDDVERLAAEQQRGAILAQQPPSSQAIAARAPEVVDAVIAALRGATPIAQIAKPFVTLAEAAEYSGLPVRLLRRIVKRGGLAAVSFAGETYVKRADLDALDLDSADGEKQSAKFAGGSE